MSVKKYIYLLYITICCLDKHTYTLYGKNSVSYLLSTETTITDIVYYIAASLFAHNSSKTRIIS